MAQYNNVRKLHLLLSKVPSSAVAWESFISELCQQLKCRAGLLVMTNSVTKNQSRILYSHNIPPHYLNLYAEKYNRLDSFNFFISKTPEYVFHTQAPKKNAIQKQLLPHQQFRFGIAFPYSTHHSLNLFVVPQKFFSDVEIKIALQFLKSLIAVIKEAIHEEQRQKIHSQLIHFLGKNFDSFIIIDRSQKILFSDPVYTSLINDMDCVEISDNHFSMTLPDLQKRLQTALNASNDKVSIHNQCKLCQILLMPMSVLHNLYQWEHYSNGFILVFSHHPKTAPLYNRLSEIYHLSKCEIVCALHFMESASIAEIALKTNRSQETIRNHIKHCMHKMDVHNQAELMKKLISISVLK